MMSASGTFRRGECMRKFLTHVAWVVLVCSGGVVAKQMYREKTFVSSLCPEQMRALLWTNLMQQMDMVSKRRMGGRLQITASAFSTAYDKDFAQYFGMYNPMRNAVESFIGVDQNDINEPLASMNLIHDYARATSVYVGYGIRDKIELRPEKRQLSCTLDYVHGFDAWCEGLSVRISIPFVSVKTSMNPRTMLLDSRGMNLPGTGKHVTLTDFLAGDVVNTDSSNTQAALKKLKIVRGFQETKGLSDIEMALRVRLWQSSASHLDVGVKAVLPVNNTLTGDFLFEPLRGNGGHHGIGGEVLLDFLAFEHGDLNVEIVLNADCIYLFPANEIRVPLFKDAQGNIPAFAGYQLGGRLGSAGVFPMANVLVNEFKVSPGHRGEVVLSAIVSSQGLSLELGAGARGCSQEHVALTTWKDNDVGLVGWDYKTTATVATSNLWSTASIGPDGVAVNAAENLRTVNSASLDLASITTPSMLNAYVFGFAGYSFADWDYPLSFGLGLAHEVALSSNAAPPGWNIMFKFGATF